MHIQLGQSDIDCGGAGVVGGGGGGLVVEGGGGGGVVVGAGVLGVGAGNVGSDELFASQRQQPCRLLGQRASHLILLTVSQNPSQWGLAETKFTQEYNKFSNRAQQ